MFVQTFACLLPASMAPATMLITRSTTEITTCTPNLMPFHIDYTGPAAVSAFMRVEKLKIAETAEATEEAAEASTESMPADVEMELPTVETSSNETRPTPDADSESQATVVASTSASQAASPSITPSSSTATVVATTPVSLPPLEDADKRFVASFRGRTIHGLTIDLPEGYGGLLLQSEKAEKDAVPQTTKAFNGGEKTKPTTRGKEKASEPEQPSTSTRKRGRLTRSAAPSSKPIEIADDDDVIMANAAPVENSAPGPTVDNQISPEDDTAVRRLVPSAQFSSFTLWQPDRVVDKNRDEYYRSLVEWVSLANEVHSIPCINHPSVLNTIGYRSTGKSRTDLFA